jgi:molecular chaperone GrpE
MENTENEPDKGNNKQTNPHGESSDQSPESLDNVEEIVPELGDSDADNSPQQTQDSQTVKDSSPESEVVQNDVSDEITIEALRLMLEEARGKADENWDQLLRTKAEFENLRRRSQRDVENAHKFALDRFTEDLLPVKDSLELGVNAGKEENASLEKLLEGTELTLKMLQTVMEKFGIKEIDPLDQPFNPEYHQAMSIQESADKEPNTVLIVFQKGYSLNDRLIRPARVIVSKAPQNTNTEVPVKEKPPKSETLNDNDVDAGKKGTKIDEQA